MDGLLPWHCHNDVGAYRAIALWHEGMVRMARRVVILGVVRAHEAEIVFSHCS